MEIIQTFPVMNRPYAQDIDDDVNDDSYLTDYSVGKTVIYIGFAWSVAEEAYEKVIKLAQKHEVGFFDVSEEEGNILFPKNGTLEPIQ